MPHKKDEGIYKDSFKGALPLFIALLLIVVILYITRP